jgi:hypothetical protein
MGFFAISKRGSSSAFTIEACHLCFWVLPRSWFRYFYYFDVGLRISVLEDLRRIRVAFPFDSERDDLVDLSTVVLDSEFSPLIFGRPVRIDRDRVEYAGTGLGIEGNICDRVLRISVINSAPELETADDINFSVWTIEFEETAAAEQSIYIRFRLRVKDPRRLWSPKGWGYAKRGVIADFRVSDVRESVLLGLGKSEANHIVPIKGLFAFLVAPSQFVPKHVSPSLHYSRLLESSVWAKYLNVGPRRPLAFWRRLVARWPLPEKIVRSLRQTAISYRSEKFSIHQWRSKDVVTIDSPFRGYADVTREFGAEIWFYYVLAAAGVHFLPIFLGATWNFVWPWLEPTYKVIRAWL